MLALSRQWKDQPWDGALSVSMILRLPRPKGASARKRPWPAVKPDLDNLAKGVLDAANGILWVDDAQIVQLSVEKQYGEPGIWLCLARYAS